MNLGTMDPPRKYLLHLAIATILGDLNQGVVDHQADWVRTSRQQESDDLDLILAYRKVKRSAIGELAFDQLGVSGHQSLELIQFASSAESKHLPNLVARSGRPDQRLVCAQFVWSPHVRTPLVA